MKTGSRRRVLLVEDDPITARVCAVALEQEGFEVSSVDRGGAVLDHLRRHPADFLLLDLVLPDGDGLLVLEKIRAEPRLKNLPIIVTTGVRDRKVLVKAFQLEVDDFLVKPFITEELLVRFKSILHKRDLEARLRQSNQDLTRALEDLKKTEADLVQNAKLAAIGTLAAGVAHELNQPLVVIRGLVQMQLQERDLPAPLRKDLDSIEAQTSRMKRIIEHLTTFARKDQEERIAVDVNLAIQNAMLFMDQKLRQRGVTLVLDLADPGPYVLGNPTQLEQVVLNLVLNARDALDGCASPAVTIRTRAVGPEKLPGRAAPGGSATNYVSILVADNGCGMAQSDLGKIFDPFFTTKSAGKGTGLGLSVSYNIVQSLHGWITVESRPGAGSTFEVVLPAVDCGASEADAVRLDR